MIIAIDFDGTCVTHDYPNIGKDIGAAPVLKHLVESGHQLMLWTMRSDETLADAVKWFSDNEIPLWGINQNPDQHTWTTSKKQYAHRYIDDAAIGCPLVFLYPDDNSFYAKNLKEKGLPEHQRPYVNWSAIAVMLAGDGLTPSTMTSKEPNYKIRQG